MFSLISSAGVLLFPLLIYFAFIKQLQILDKYRNKKIFKIVIVILLGLLSLGPILYFQVSRANLVPSLVPISSYFMGTLILLFFSSLFFYIFRFIFWLFKQKRRKLFEVVYLVIVAIYIIGSFYVGLSFPVLRTEKISIENFPASDYKIIHLSDVHLGPFLDHDFSKKLVSYINEIKPDLVAISGDFNDADPEHIKEVLEPWKKLISKDGVYMSLGNHEFYHDPIGIRNFVTQELKFNVLINNTILIQKESGNFRVMGISDPVGTRFGLFAPDYEIPFKDQDNSIPTILIAHRPSMYQKLKNDVDLMLSGHTHGGQIFPFGFLVKIVEPYIFGLHKVSDRAWLNVSRGTGFWGPPIRFPYKSEIVEMIINPTSSN